jgi:hypothetical protein
MNLTQVRAAFSRGGVCKRRFSAALTFFLLLISLPMIVAQQSAAQPAPRYRLDRIYLTVYPENPSHATDINDNGYVTANLWNPPEYSARWAGHLWTSVQSTEIDFGYGQAINSHNQVVGRVGRSNDMRGIFWNGAQEVILDDLAGGQNWVVPNALTDSGTSYGWSLGGTTNRMTAVGWTPSGQIFELGIDSTGYEGSRATDANNQGQVAGYNSAFGSPSNQYDGWVWKNGLVETLPSRPGAVGPRSTANAINESGQVGGLYVEEVAGQLVAYPAVWTGGPPTLLTLPAGYREGWVEDINNLGYTVGTSIRDTPTISRATLWTPAGQGFALESLIDESYGWQLEHALAINNHNQIVGIAIDPQGVQRGYVLTPIPEPATALLVACAGTMLSLRRQASRRIVRSIC